MDVEHGERVNSLRGHGSVISHIAWSQDSKCLFSGGMTALTSRPPASDAATLRALAWIEARRYARHPLFLIGVALLAVVLAATGYTRSVTVSPVLPMEQAPGYAATNELNSPL